MSAYSWAGLADALPQVFFPDYDLIDSRIQLCDRISDDRVLLYIDDASVFVKVVEPADPARATRLRAVIESQRTSSFSRVPDPHTGELRPPEEAMWMPESRSADGTAQSLEWSTGWRVHAEHKEEVAAAVLAVMCDGLGMAIDGLRFISADRRGPRDSMGWTAGRPIPSDRPTHRDAPEYWTDWRDFTERLDWALTTLPQRGIVVLSAPEGGPSAPAMDFQLNGAMIEGNAVLRQSTPATRDRLDQHLSKLGWRLAPVSADDDESSTWRAPEAWIGSVIGLQDLARHTALIFAEIADVPNPSDLAFAAGALGNPDTYMTYLDAELGLARM
ncbi:TY-Chap domain-containing protein [Nocardia sp. NPDC004123]